MAGFAIAASSSAYDNTVYLIRHGEKPKSGDGLSPKGQKRAQCISKLFDLSSNYNIGYILAETPETGGERDRPFLTVQPLAAVLGLQIDISCGRDHHECVAEAVKKFTKKSNKNILVCWEHGALTEIAEKLGIKPGPVYPSDLFNQTWAIWDKTLTIGYEDCPGLDPSEDRILRVQI
ncbi:putative phosphoglycerate mutase family protein [Sistotremastrum niveocremeum HHB9708]|uniref:Putative phosphoglycerate mutase family protein n=2 Tax=Sistotremastraceae TaxID=3402574 RepID=A0A164NA30_9AGAM|nr:putative phosphoglycerate mutase family protein [Sistotremastrum niveocremeum HHB9708]KZT38143.1 putative phosphoglycerate mutase family protein [Sistotremastrum suecicum HHB10207 ss-3]